MFWKTKIMNILMKHKYAKVIKYSTKNDTKKSKTEIYEKVMNSDLGKQDR